MFALCRVALDSFGHLSENDRSVLVDYPVHKLAALSAGGKTESCLPFSDVITAQSGHEDGEGVLPMDTVPLQTHAASSSDEVLMEVNEEGEKDDDILEEEDEDSGQISQQYCAVYFLS